MLTPAWTKLRYHPQQARLWRTSARFVGVAAGRGSGKTEIARRRVVRFLPIKKPWADPLYFYALPTYAQAKRVAWGPLEQLIPRDWLKKAPNRSEMVFETVWGSKLYVVGMDKPQRIEGVQWDGGVVDESSDQRPGVFDKSVGPALTHRNGWCWRIGVPKRHGVGAPEFKRFCQSVAQEGYSWPSEDILTEAQLAYARATLDPRDFNEQYRASWESSGGGVFHAFDPVLNVSDQVCYDKSRPIVVGSDFNVDPMSWCVGTRYDQTLHVWDEIFFRNTNTRETLDRLYARYGTHERGWDFFGDAAGRQRKTSASTSDYLQIRNDARFRGLRVFYPKANPMRADRFAACNAMLCSASGARRVIIHPRCVNLIRDLQDRAYEEGTSEPDDYGDVGHMSDAFGYIIHRVWPIVETPHVGSVGVHLTRN